jgi:Uncharacterized protein conserved in bacteria
MHLHTRREFLSTGLKGAGLLAASAFVPGFVTRTAAATGAGRDAGILVVVQLSGGNDGLNTVVPFADDAYIRARPTLHLAADQTLRLTDRLGLHPALGALRKEYDAGHMAIVQNVGYPNPNRSHFRSMEIWHTGADDTEARQVEGWIGRYFDAQCAGCDPAKRPGEIGVSFGKVMPQAFRNQSNVGLAVNDPDTFQWNPSGDTATFAKIQERVFEKINQPAGGRARMTIAGGISGTEPATIDFLRHTAMNAVVAGDSMRAILKREKNKGRYPDSRLAAQLQMVARLVTGDFPARVYYVSQGGYDTHSDQLGNHARLLGDFSSSVGAFLDDLRRQKSSDRVTVLAFSEFGRRVAENGSRGTDHGAAAPLFVLGDAVKGGLHGDPPDLTDLVGGDVRHKIDFRQVYASLLNDWLGLPARRVLGNDWPGVRVV